MASSFLSSGSSASAGPSRLASSSSATPTPAVSSASAAQKPDRLFVGNLSPTVDEYTLIQIFSRFGKIAKLDYLFHKSGPLRGKPRGFAFVEFTSKDDALKALLKLNDRVLRGRKLSVTYASQTQHPEHSQSTYHRGRGGRHNDPPRTTTLSLIKNQRRPVSAAAQIAALEAKLSTMQKSPLAAASATAPAARQGSQDPPASTSASASVSEAGTPGPLTEEDIEVEMARLRAELEADLEQARIAAGLAPSGGVSDGLEGGEGMEVDQREVEIPSASDVKDKGKGKAIEREDLAPVTPSAAAGFTTPAMSPAEPADAPADLPAPAAAAATAPPQARTTAALARPRGSLPPPPPGLPRKPPASIHEPAFSRR